MGAIGVWIAQHARQLAAWAVFVAAISALVVAISRSGAGDTISAGLSNARSFFLTATSRTHDLVGLVDDASSKALEKDDSGWVQLFYYCLYLRGFREILNLVVTNFRSLVVAILAAWAVCWRVFAALFVFSKGVALARWMSNGEIAKSSS